jgi:hypothetical protein
MISGPETFDAGLSAAGHGSLQLDQGQWGAVVEVVVVGPAGLGEPVTRCPPS